jgi:1-acyl-sn-glycerol-3-phosphate acyltransferase
MHLHYRITQLVLRALFQLVFRTRFRNTHHVPASGGALVVSNHISYLDPPVMGMAVAPRELAFLAKRELFRNPFFGWLITVYSAIPVNRGHVERSLLARLVDLMRQGGMLIVFPEGTRSKTGELGSAKPGVGMLALQAGVTVVPAYLTGTRTFWRAFLRTGAVTVTFDTPILPEELARFPQNEAGYRAASTYFLERIRTIRDRERAA